MDQITSAVAWRLRKAIDGRRRTEPTRDGTAVVMSRDADGTIWVNIPGSDIRTPVNGTVNAEVHPNDVVGYHIENGRLSITGNPSSPSIGTSRVMNIVEPIDRKASDAIGYASAAHDAADLAEREAQRASIAADAAQDSATQAERSAQQAIADAAQANEAATEAQESASQAKTSANTALRASNDALTQLSVVEDVAGTITWISEHGSYVPTTDTAVVAGRVYFELVDGDYVPVAQPTGNPKAQRWYVLDVSESQTEYIMAHLAVTSAGLWVLPSGLGDATSEQYAAGYKALLAPDGMYVFDGSGHLVATYGESITLDSSRPQYIGGEDAYILYYDSDEDGSPDSIVIGGSNVRFDGVPLSEMLGASDALHYDHEFTVATDPVTGVTTYTFTAHLFRGATEVTDQVDPEFFCWWLRTEAGDTFLGHGRTMAVDASRAGYNGSVIGGVDDVLHFALIDDEDDEMQDDEADTIVGEWLLSEAAGRD